MKQVEFKNLYAMPCAHNFSIFVKLSSKEYIFLQDFAICFSPFYHCCNISGDTIDRVARRNKMKVVPDYIGHGIGAYFHGPPEVYHYCKYLCSHLLILIEQTQLSVPWLAKPCFNQGSHKAIATIAMATKPCALAGY